MKRITKIFDGYFITTDGRVLLSRPHKNQYGSHGWRRQWLKTRVQNSGYSVVDIGKKTYTVHKLVASHFLVKKIEDEEINHIDRNKLNNNVSNLEWCTHKYNMIHSWIDREPSEKQREAIREIGSRKKTDDHKLNIGLSKLSIDKDTIISVKNTYKKGIFGVIKTSKKLGLSHSVVQRILEGKLDKYFN